MAFNDEMSTQIFSVSESAILKAANHLKSGALVAFPTETVYGLGANALNGTAVARIFEAKGRPSFNPLISHVLSLEEAEQYGTFSDDARKLAHYFWPGALTMIVPRRADCDISDLVTAGLDTIALRVPAHKVARQLLKACGFPLAAPSANASGEVSPTAPAHVTDSLKDKVEFILAAGSCQIGLESTVIDMSTEQPAILRPGSITPEDIANILGRKVELAIECAAHTARDGKNENTRSAPKSPGQLLKHYAPSRPVRLNAIDLRPDEALLAFGSDKFMGIQGGGSAQNLPDTARKNLSETGDLYEAASNLFSMLRALDRPEHKGVAVMAVPDVGIGIAINDRLRRAAQG
ncbi:MAG: L-threonylcarbamoyladenylate synthase [Alphaproteobacteria bacterium]